MSVGFSNTVANAILNHLRGGATWVPPDEIYIKLHIGDPGAAGSANPAANTLRKFVTLGGASGGSVSNSSLLQWLAVSDNETYSHASLWSAVTGGSFLISGVLPTPVTVTAGATFTVPSGELDFGLNVAA